MGTGRRCSISDLANERRCIYTRSWPQDFTLLHRYVWLLARVRGKCLGRGTSGDRFDLVVTTLVESRSVANSVGRCPFRSTGSSNGSSNSRDRYGSRHVPGISGNFLCNFENTWDARRPNNRPPQPVNIHRLCSAGIPGEVPQRRANSAPFDSGVRPAMQLAEVYREDIARRHARLHELFAIAERISKAFRSLLMAPRGSKNRDTDTPTLAH